MSATRSREPILGYEVTERIGAGGYGEVWKATAPGGLTKAIKFVYGYLDDERARRELKALSRVKLVRHPFLLSLERIEVVDGQLVIVTELADKSLKDRFEECKAAGMVGIPREELLGYLRDAADALDYMRDKYSLQHLDVKPENLLLVSGYVKVADFGLVKDIDDTRASMMGGLTPIYASPEVFDDRPSQCSDQYSLAIVYQEMLTDTLPFPGKTTAQLAAQHLQSRPRLTALPPQDKAIIERALCKDPAARYPTAREMVDALFVAGRSTSQARPAAPASSDTTPLATNETHSVRLAPAPAPESCTQMLEGGQPAAPPPAAGPSSATATCVGVVEKSPGPPHSEAPEVSLAPPLGEVASIHQTSTQQGAAPPSHQPASISIAQRRARTQPTIRDLPPLDVTATATVRPTLFVGLGGTARQVLGQLQRRLSDRFGDLKKVPAVQLLAADTNPDVEEGEPDTSVNAENLLAMPLRRPEDYRRGSTRLLAWMSRRWLYNIPRSLETEGLRPLGRLALVDHATSLVEQLNAALDTITDPATLAATAAATGLPLEDVAPRVTLVASISGGTGGGMALDVAYLLRNMVRARGLADDCLQILLLHWTGRNTAAHELAVANTFGTLSELDHFYRHGYPGEAAFELPPSSADQSRLPNMYLVHLGGELSEHDLPGAARDVADYLFLGTATAAAGWLNAAQHESPPPPDGTATNYDIFLRTFGICRLGAGDELIGIAADAVCGALLEQWCGAVSDRHVRQSGAADRALRPPLGMLSSADIGRFAGERIALMDLSLDTITDALERAAESCLGCDVDSFLGSEVTRIASLPLSTGSSGDLNDEPHPQIAALDRALGMPASGAEATRLVAALEAHVREACRQQAQTLRAWALELADNPRIRFAGAAQAIEELARHVRPLRDVAQKTRNKTAEEMRTAAVVIIGGKSRSRLWPARGTVSADDQHARLLQYANLKFMDTLFAMATKFAQQLAWELTSIADSLSEARRELARLALLFEHEARPRHAAREGAAVAIDTALGTVLEQRRPQFLAQLDEEFQGIFVREHGGLWAGLAKGREFRDSLVAMLRSRSRIMMLGAVRSAALAQKPFEGSEKGMGGGELLSSCLSEAMPELSSCGGERRLLVICGQQQEGAALAEAVTKCAGHAPSVVVDDAIDPVLCYEMAAVPLWEAAVSLIDGQPHCAALAARLHTRCDIEWSPLPLPS